MTCPQVCPVAMRSFDEHGMGCTAGRRLGSNEQSQLQSNTDWTNSNFSLLEGFIADYLAGGASAGEGVRLKLQTPLFVSEALLDTAQKQLAGLLATAEEVGPASLPCSDLNCARAE